MYVIERDGYFGVYFPRCEATRIINTKVTLEWAQKQLVTRVHTLFYFLHDITNPWMTIKTTSFTHRPRVSLARFSSCWWRHNRLPMTSQWPGNCDAITRIVISNSLDIDFIHGDIHDRSCKKHVRNALERWLIRGSSSSWYIHKTKDRTWLFIQEANETHVNNRTSHIQKNSYDLCIYEVYFIHPNHAHESR